MKNQRLGMKDLFWGRVVYLAEPGIEPVKVLVLRKNNAVVRGSFISITSKPMSAIEALRSVNGNGKIASVEMIAKFPPTREVEPGCQYVIKDFVSPVQFVHIMDENGDVHFLQDVYLDPAESRLRVFAKEKQAKRYSTFPETFGVGLETIFAGNEK